MTTMQPPPSGPDVLDLVELAAHARRHTADATEDRGAVVYAALALVLLSASSLIIATTPAGTPTSNANAIDRVNRYNDDLAGQRARCRSLAEDGI
ncbi:MAG: hypothetical protein AAF721_07730 [Myxococcota bacterium]